MIIQTILLLIILIVASSCQQVKQSVVTEALPTRFILPTSTVTPVDIATAIASSTATEIPATKTATATLTNTATWLPSPSPSNTPTITPTRRPIPETFIFGRSAGDRELLAYRFGIGDRLIMLVGAIHGGYESNTSDLMQELIEHFRQKPADILPDVTLLIVPVLNPDGEALRDQLAGRFNGNQVDLNRNWGCGWQEEAYFRDQQVNAGTQPFSEPETQAMAALINDLRPDAVLFYHSAADGIFAGGCGEDAGSEELAQVLGASSGYSYGTDFSAYTVTGTAPAWVNSIGIPSVDIELATANSTEFNQNLRGIMAVQCWVSSLEACR